MIKGGQRIATATGVMLADPNGLGNPPLRAEEALFDSNFWAARNELAAVSGGRGSAWFVGSGAVEAVHPWVLRHYRRGGFIARISQDRYIWSGEDRVRAFAEWRLLYYLAQRGLNVPKPVAAFYRRAGLGGSTYRCDLITERIAHSRALSAVLGSNAPAEPVWREVGAAIARLHRHGVDHADLNAHNILLDEHGTVSVIDFDRGRLREPGAWTAGNLARLQRSLAKIAAGLPPDRYTPAAWQQLMAGYREA
ncbi:MAG TPA: 3-deoxy-D-manno-octulosonic acid kinase [Steroidobacteraceae bacterium]|jgi:3-deoxy-D-manno-octulosonic acid kinase|nr:3-deoxy-D-manno-octulosonic acid kinase [Steroidobacteraceae bacterium]